MNNISIVIGSWGSYNECNEVAQLLGFSALVDVMNLTTISG